MPSYKAMKTKLQAIQPGAELVLQSLIPYPSEDFKVLVSSFDGMRVHVAEPLPYRPGTSVNVTDFNILEGYAVRSINCVRFNSKERT